MKKSFLAWIVGGFLSFSLFAFMASPVRQTATFQGRIEDGPAWVTKKAQQGYKVTAMCGDHYEVLIVMDKD